MQLSPTAIPPVLIENLGVKVFTLKSFGLIIYQEIKNLLVFVETLRDQGRIPLQIVHIVS